MRRRRLALCLALSLALVPAACGGEGGESEGSGGIGQGGEISRTDAPTDEAPREPATQLTEIEGAIEARDIRLQRVALQDAGPEIGIEPLEYAREALPATGQEFDLYVFADPERARQALDEIRGTELAREGAIVVGGNVVAVLPAEPEGDPALEAVAEVVREAEGS